MNLDLANKHIAKEPGKCARGCCANCGDMPYVGWHEAAKRWFCLGCMDEYDQEEEFDDFDCCENCDLPDSCSDFGCAIKQGIRTDPYYSL